MTISALPTAPSRDMTPSNFIVASDAFVAALPTFITEANELQLDVNGKQITASSAASTATTKATEALSSANTATSAKDAAIIAKNDAEAAAAIIEQALIDGPVLSVNGDTGVVVVTPASISAQPVMQQATQAEMEAGSEAGIRSMSPLNVTQAINTKLAATGSTPTGSVVLTATSSAAQSVTTTLYGQSITLPDATACEKGAVRFVIKNNGGYDLTIKNSAGVTKGFLSPSDSCVAGLADNSTAAGEWVLSGVNLLGTTATFSLNLNGTASTIDNVLVLDDFRSLVIYAHYSSFYAVVYDVQNNTVGTPTLIGGIGNVHPTTYIPISNGVVTYKLDASRVLVVAGGQAANTTQQATVVSISGTTISAGTPLTITSAGAPYDIVDIGNGFVVSFVLSDTTAASVITVTGTTITLVASSAASGLPTANKRTTIYPAGTGTFVAFYFDGSNGVNSIINSFSLTGTTLTTNTPLRLSATTCFGTYKIDDTHFVSLTITSGVLSLNIFTLTGTTFTRSFASSPIGGNSDSRLLPQSDGSFGVISQSAILKFTVTDNTPSLSGELASNNKIISNPLRVGNNIVVGGVGSTSTAFVQVDFSQATPGVINFTRYSVEGIGISTELLKYPSCSVTQASPVSIKRDDGVVFVARDSLSPVPNILHITEQGIKWLPYLAIQSQSQVTLENSDIPSAFWHTFSLKDFTARSFVRVEVAQ